MAGKLFLFIGERVIELSSDADLWILDLGLKSPRHM
jgi:hypothetical protein